MIFRFNLITEIKMSIQSPVNTQCVSSVESELYGCYLFDHKASCFALIRRIERSDYAHAQSSFPNKHGGEEGGSKRGRGSKHKAAAALRAQHSVSDALTAGPQRAEPGYINLKTRTRDNAACISLRLVH